MDRKLIWLSIASLLLVVVTLLAFAPIATAETARTATTEAVPVTGPSLDQVCTTCHREHDSGHPGDCVDCHVVTSTTGTRHPDFRPITDGVCIACHQKGSLP